MCVEVRYIQSPRPSGVQCAKQNCYSKRVVENNDCRPQICVIPKSAPIRDSDKFHQ